MKSILLTLLLLLSADVHACEKELAGSYFLRSGDAELVEALQLRNEHGRLVAYTRAGAGWEANPQQPEPYPASAFSSFTKQEAPPGYCGVLVSGLIVARVTEGWHWGGLTSTSGFVIISIGGPREAVRK